MAKLRAVLLAAGLGVRMGGGMPKTLLPVEDNEPLLYYLLQGIKAAGVDDLLVVTGHRPDDITEFVDKHAEGLEVTYLRNARYASWGNFHSLRVAIDQSPGMDVLVLNSDIVINPEVLQRVARTEGDLVLAIERRQWGLDEEDMRVQLDGTRVLDIGKDLKMARSHGEFCGVSLLRPPASAEYLDVATDLEWTSQTSLYYEDVYKRMIPRVEARGALLQELEYAEVDTPEDVRAAGEVISRHRDAWTHAGA